MSPINGIQIKLLMLALIRTCYFFPLESGVCVAMDSIQVKICFMWFSICLEINEYWRHNYLYLYDKGVP